MADTFHRCRRKRNTADSGYGSEQPLDRRWSQEFAHEVRNNLSATLTFIVRPLFCFLLGAWLLVSLLPVSP